MFILELTVSVDYTKAAPNAMLPLHLTSGAAGSDLFSTLKKAINQGQTVAVDFDLNIKIPKGYFGLVSGRSSVALKGVMTHVGIIDSDFFGIGRVILTNIGQNPYEIKPGDRIGQITLVKYSKANWIKSDSFKAEVFNWISSDAQDKHAGFGSTGV